MYKESEIILPEVNVPAADIPDSDVLVLFSGGRDSTLAVCQLAALGKKITLMNCLNGTTIRNEIVKERVTELKERFPCHLKQFIQVPTFGLFRKLAFSQIEEDFRCYKTNLMCLGCKMAAHTQAILYCIENDIKVIADGYNRYQAGEFMEQRPEAIEILKNFSAEYGLLYINPIYDCLSKKEVKYELFNYGLSTKSLEGTCVFGDTYSIPKPGAVISYISAKLPMCRDFIKTRTKKEADVIGKPKIHKIGAVIIKNKKILVIRKQAMSQEEYIIPGAIPTVGETHKDTLKRGLKEELGISIKSYHLLGSFSEIAVFENIPIYMDVYHVGISGKPHPKSGIKDILWIDREYEKNGTKIGTVLSRHVIPKLVNMEIM